MSEDHDEKLSHEEIKERLRTGYSFYPTQPGLKEAARELVRPLVEKMDGQEIIYVCRVPKLMRVNYLETDDDGFRAVATTLHDLGDRILTFEESAAESAFLKSRKNIESREELRAARNTFRNTLLPDPKPLNFGAKWAWLRLSGSGIKMNMITDCFYPDPAVVAEVKDAVSRNALGEISGILERASSKR